MKKLVLAALAVLAVVFAFDAEARYNCGACPKKSCKSACRVIEAERPTPPCCVRYVRVEEPAQEIKHVSYSYECPSDCAVEGNRHLMVGQTQPD